jgi:hypothetical protein
LAGRPSNRRHQYNEWLATTPAQGGTPGIVDSGVDAHAILAARAYRIRS